MTLGAALAGSVVVGTGDRRGAVEPQAAAINVATSATAANFQREVDAGPRVRTSGLHAMRLSLGEVFTRRQARPAAGCRLPDPPYGSSTVVC